MQENSDTSIRYGFAHPQQNLDAKVGGAERLIFDLELMIKKTLGGSPQYRTDGENSSLLDPRLPLIVLNPEGFEGRRTSSDDATMSSNLDDRTIAIHARIGGNLKGYGYNSNHAASIICDYSFCADNTDVRNHKSNQNDTIVDVHFLPSRMTPAAIQQAAASYIGKKPRGDITTMIVGDLSWGGGGVSAGSWNSERLIATIRKQVKAAGQEVFLTTGPRTTPEDEQHLIDVLQPWLGDVYLWGKEKESGRPNPLLAWCSFAARILFTADSLSVSSDAVASGKSFLLIHDWQPYSSAEQLPLTSKIQSRWRYAADQLFKTDRYTWDGRQERLMTIKQIRENSARMSHRLLLHGVSDLYDSQTVRPPPEIETGLPELMRVIEREVHRVHRQLNY